MPQKVGLFLAKNCPGSTEKLRTQDPVPKPYAATFDTLGGTRERQCVSIMAAHNAYQGLDILLQQPYQASKVNDGAAPAEQLVSACHGFFSACTERNIALTGIRQV